MFLASLACTFIVPVLLYAFLLVAKALRPSKSALIDSIVFDIGDVLIDVQKNKHIDEMDVRPEVRDFLKKYMGCSDIWLDFDAAQYTEEETIRRFVEMAPDMETEIRDYFATIADDMNDFPYSRFWTAGLKQAGYDMYILSNWPLEKRQDVIDHGNMAFLPVFDKCIWSCEEKLRKPDPAIFEALIEKTGLDPKRTVYIDDSPTNIKVAASFGFITIQFRDYQQAVTALRAYNVTFRG